MVLARSLVAACLVALLVTVASAAALAEAPSARPAPLSETPLGALGRTPVVVFAPDGSALAVATDDGTVRVFEASSGALLGALEVDATRLAAARIAVAPGGAQLVLAGSQLEILDVATGAQVERRRDGEWSEPSFSPDGRFLALVHAPDAMRRELQVRDLRGVEPQRAWPLGASSHAGEAEIYATRVVFSPDAALVFVVENAGWVASCGGGVEWTAVEVYDRAKGTQHVAWRDTLASPLAEVAESTGDEAALLHGYLSDVAVTPSHAWFAIVTTHGEVVVWDVAAFAAAPDSGASITYRALAADDLLQPRLAADGSALLAVTYDPSLVRVGLADGPELDEVLPTGAVSTEVRAIGAPGWAVVELVEATERRAVLWSLDSGERVGCLWRDAPTSTAAFSPDGARLVRVRADATLEVWDTAALHDPRIGAVLACD